MEPVSRPKGPLPKETLTRVAIGFFSLLISLPCLSSSRGYTANVLGRLSVCEKKKETVNYSDENTDNTANNSSFSTFLSMWNHNFANGRSEGSKKRVVFSEKCPNMIFEGM